MKTILLLITFIILPLAGFAKDYELKAVEDNLILPYRFIPLESETGLKEIWIPFVRESEGTEILAMLGADWVFNDTVSSVVFFADLIRRDALGHYNFDTELFNAFVFDDFDGDSLQDIAVTYPRHDSVFINVLNPQKGNLYHRFLVAGIDRDGNGFWDGGCNLTKPGDINGDGNPEIFIGIDTGYDLYPRKLICLDIYNDTILWEFSYAGIMNIYNSGLIYDSRLEENRFMLSLTSKGNAAITRDMDDRHAYLVLLDANGNELWKQVVGQTFDGCHAVCLDFDGDGRDEIVTNRIVKNINTSNNSDVRMGEIVVFDLDGNELHQIDLGANIDIVKLEAIDLENDGQMELIVSSKENIIWIFSHDLKLLKKCVTYSLSQIWDVKDILGLGFKQFLHLTLDNQLIITDQDFKPFASIQLNVRPAFGPYFQSIDNQGEGLLYINTIRMKSCHIFGFEKSPWYTFFSRHPIYAFLAGALPLGLITTIIWIILAKFRQKNRIITEQRDRLNIALKDLKSTQEKLIAAEKFKQARDIAGGVAHEIHNAIFPTLALIDKIRELVKADNIDHDRMFRLIDLVEKATNRANKMTSLVTDFIGLESQSSKESVNILEIVNEILATHSEQIKKSAVGVQISIDSDLFIEFNRLHFHSMINNLFINALDAVAESIIREIMIEAEKTEEFVITITDTGCGINPDDHSRIFNAFYSTKPATGTGLGLSVVQKIIELNNGRIELKSKLDNGTKIVIFLTESKFRS